jgi:hypothetical protein
VQPCEKINLCKITSQTNHRRLLTRGSLKATLKQIYSAWKFYKKIDVKAYRTRFTDINGANYVGFIDHGYIIENFTQIDKIRRASNKKGKTLHHHHTFQSHFPSQSKHEYHKYTPYDVEHTQNTISSGGVRASSIAINIMHPLLEYTHTHT